MATKINSKVKQLGKKSTTTMNEEQHYRLMAANRIYADRKLRHLRHLLKRRWCNNPDFWRWIATDSDSMDQIDAVYLSPNGLERTAFHEAGHAVAACLVGFPFKSATIVPARKLYGNVDYPDPILKIEGFAFHLWRQAVISAAGPAAETKFSEEKPLACNKDLMKAVYTLRHFGGDELVAWLQSIAATANLIVDNPKIWLTIQWFANQLLRYGTVQHERVDKFLAKSIGECQTESIVIDCLEKMRQACESITGNKDELVSIWIDANNVFFQELNKLIDHSSFSDTPNFQPPISEATYMDYLLQLITSRL